MLIEMIAAGVGIGLFIKIISAVGKQQTLKANAPTVNAREVQNLTLLDLSKGITPNRYNLSGFLPKKGETVLWSFQGVNYYHQGTHSEWQGRSAGVSVRIVKGFWLRSGANRGHSVQATSMDLQGRGALILTDKAFCFVGSDTTVRVPLAHIMNIQQYSDGIGLLTDYARNSKYCFTNLYATDIEFISNALDALNGVLPEEKLQVVSNLAATSIGEKQELMQKLQSTLSEYASMAEKSTISLSSDTSDSEVQEIRGRLVLKLNKAIDIKNQVELIQHQMEEHPEFFKALIESIPNQLQSIETDVQALRKVLGGLDKWIAEKSQPA